MIKFNTWFYLSPDSFKFAFSTNFYLISKIFESSAVQFDSEAIYHMVDRTHRISDLELLQDFHCNKFRRSPIKYYQPTLLHQLVSQPLSLMFSHSHHMISCA